MGIVMRKIVRSIAMVLCFIALAGCNANDTTTNLTENGDNQVSNVSVSETVTVSVTEQEPIDIQPEDNIEPLPPELPDILKNAPDYQEALETGTLYAEQDESPIYILLDRDDSEDVSLFGLSDGSITLLSVKNEIYRLDFEWHSSQLRCPELSVYDYDGDGEKEFAVHLVLGTGSGVYQDGLIMLEVSNGKAVSNVCNIFSFTETMSKLSWNLDEKSKLWVYFEGREGMAFDAKNVLKSMSGDFEGLDYGDICYFSKADGYFRLAIVVGMKFSEIPLITYEISPVVIGDVFYVGDSFEYRNADIYGEMEW